LGYYNGFRYRGKNSGNDEVREEAGLELAPRPAGDIVPNQIDNRNSQKDEERQRYGKENDDGQGIRDGTVL
jgi:hypothetical protein